MYSRMAGTGEVSASLGSQILAARRAPSETGMKRFSMSWTRRGKELTVLMFLLAYPRSIHFPGGVLRLGRGRLLQSVEVLYNASQDARRLDLLSTGPGQGHRAPRWNKRGS